VNSLYGDGTEEREPAEVRLRVALRSEDRRVAAVAGEEVEALYTNGPAGGGGARKYVRSIVSVASVLIPQSDVEIQVILDDGKEA